jgi:hypothetical protein
MSFLLTKLGLNSKFKGGVAISFFVSSSTFGISVN